MSIVQQSSQPRVLFVDDDGEAVTSLIRALRANGLMFTGEGCTSAAAALQLVAANSNNPFHVAVLDLSLEPTRGVESGFEVLTSILKESPSTRIIVLTGHGSDEYGIRALGLGAMSFLEKPANVSHLSALIREGISQATLRLRVRELESQQTRQQGSAALIPGQGATAQRLSRELDFLAANRISVFFKGETGVGKSFYARALHDMGRAAGVIHGEFISYAPRAGGSDLVSSDLFGHSKGAFTGATENRRGLLSLAHGGTLFLDEVDELPAEVQVTLLTVLQEKRFRPVGASKTEPFEARIIAASNVVDIETSGLRQDLFHRLAQEVFTIPALRERREDIVPLAERFLATISAREGTSNLQLATETKRVLEHAYDWPGNVRELERAIERAVARATFERAYEIRPEHLPPQIVQMLAAGVRGDQQLTGSFAELIESYKLKLVTDALRTHNNNQVHAAAALNLDRTTLRRILARHR